MHDTESENLKNQMTACHSYDQSSRLSMRKRKEATANTKSVSASSNHQDFIVSEKTDTTVEMFGYLVDMTEEEDAEEEEEVDE